jgi:hypothetical protein
MPVYQRGKIKFESKRLHQESGRWIVMFEIDCIPPPNGGERTFVYDKEVAPMIHQQFMQAGELSAMLAGAANPGETLTSASLLTTLATNFNFGNLTIDETNLPAAWRNGERCFKVTVSYIVDYVAWEIKATAAEQFTVGADMYPKDDMVASFRILVPKNYDFRREYLWNPGCCFGDPRRKESETAGPFPKIYEFDLILPDKWKWKWDWRLSPGLEYKYKDE